MTEHEDSTPAALPKVDPDLVRISVYYDTHGYVTNVDITLNNHDPDITGIVDHLTSGKRLPNWLGGIPHQS